MLSSNYVFLFLFCFVIFHIVIRVPLFCFSLSSFSSSPMLFLFVFLCHLTHHHHPCHFSLFLFFFSIFVNILIIIIRTPSLDLQPPAASPKSLLSPLSSAGKAIVKPMRTLLEEQQSRKPLVRRDTDEVFLSVGSLVF